MAEIDCPSVISGPRRARVVAVSVTANSEDRHVTAALSLGQPQNNAVDFYKEKDKGRNRYLTIVTMNSQLSILFRRKRGIDNVKQWINIKYVNWSIPAHVQALPNLIYMYLSLSPF